MRRIYLYSTDNKPIAMASNVSRVFNSFGNAYCNHALSYLAEKLKEMTNNKYYSKGPHVPKYKLKIAVTTMDTGGLINKALTISVMIDPVYSRYLSSASLGIEREMIKQFNLTIMVDPIKNYLLAITVRDKDGNTDSEQFSPNTAQDYKSLAASFERILFRVKPVIC